jgi:hypothetical protein
MPTPGIAIRLIICAFLARAQDKCPVYRQALRHLILRAVASACLIATTTEARKAIERPMALASPILDGVLQIDPRNDVARQERIKVEALPS